MEEEAAAAAAAPDGKRPRRAKILIEDLHPGKKVTTGAAAASFTATGMDLRTGNQCREATEEEVKEVRWKFARKVRPCRSHSHSLSHSVTQRLAVRRLYISSYHRLIPPFPVHMATNNDSWARRGTCSCRRAWGTSTSRCTATSSPALPRTSWASASRVPTTASPSTGQSLAAFNDGGLLRCVW